MALLEGRNLRKTYRLGKRNTVEALRGVDVAHRRGRDGRHHGPVGLGQEHPDAHPGPAPCARPERRPAAGAGVRRAGHGRAGRVGERTRIRAREMGFVFQEFNLIPTLTALENVMLAGDYAGVGGKQSRRDSLEALALVGLEDRAGHRPSELSGGEQQRVAIARALVNRPGPRPRRRADRQPRLGALGRGARDAAPLQPGARPDLRAGDPRPDVGAACDRIVRMRDGRIQGGGRFERSLRRSRRKSEKQRSSAPRSATGRSGPCRRLSAIGVGSLDERGRVARADEVLACLHAQDQRPSAACWEHPVELRLLRRDGA